MLDVFTSSVMMTNSIVIRSGTDAILVDPAWTTNELGRIADHVAELNVVCGWSTHAHHDHVLWHPRFGPGPRYATPRAARRALERQPELEQQGTAYVAWELIPLVARLEVFNGDQLPWTGPDVVVITHNAHSPGHGALWLPDSKVLIAGDMLSDVEIPLLEDSSLADYVAGLELLEPYVREALEVIPGHGRRSTASHDRLSHGLNSPLARWDADMAYLSALTSGSGHEDPRIGGGPMWLWDAHHENLRASKAA